MADEDHEQQQAPKETLQDLTTPQQWADAVANTSDVTAVAFVSSLSPYSDAARATFVELSTTEGNIISYKVCDLDKYPEVAKAIGTISALPAFYFLFHGETLEHFCGNSMDKLRVCAKAAELKKKDVLLKIQKEKEEAERVAAERAAADASGAAATAAPAA
jgi:hypothetical protein